MITPASARSWLISGALSRGLTTATWINSASSTDTAIAITQEIRIGMWSNTAKT
ncbi:MAG: hypothetical protein A4E64_02545 [Syntrophorhabdus sp. PtaU1.Bin058]|nr:MAG: hypothetical protein A4E64_02545 [Syntrophorhabdus sp. PtaU1.Bin058]